MIKRVVSLAAFTAGFLAFRHYVSDSTMMLPAAMLSGYLSSKLVGMVLPNKEDTLEEIETKDLN